MSLQILSIVILPTDALCSEMATAECTAFWPNCLPTAAATCFSAGVASCCGGVATKQIYPPDVVLSVAFLF